MDRILSEIKGTGIEIIAVGFSFANLTSDIARLSKIIPLREIVKYVKKIIRLMNHLRT